MARKGPCRKWSKGRTRCLKRGKPASGGKRRKAKKGGGAKKKCLTGKGKLKKGWRLAKGGRCVKARG